MKIRSIIWIPLAMLLSGCGESASERAAREARDAEEMRLFLGAVGEVAGAWQGNRQPPPRMNLDFQWQQRQQDDRAQQGRQRWNVYDANGNQVGRIEPNYSPYP